MDVLNDGDVLRDAAARAVELMGDPEETGKALRDCYRHFWLVIVQRVAVAVTVVACVQAFFLLPMLSGVYESLRERVSKYEVLQRAKAEGEEYVKDRAETNIVNDIEGGNVSSSKWYLAQKAKERGYGKIVLDDEQLEKLISGATPDDLKKIAEGE